jgi:N-acetylmuramoyl-L-alanine amidase
MNKRKKRLIVWLTPRSASKLIYSILLISALICIYSLERPIWKTWTEWSLPLTGQIIVLDAGHGGYDGGAVSKGGLLEKNINLDIAFYLRDYLQEAGALVYMTREIDTDLANPDTNKISKRKTEDLMKRVEIISDVSANIFISIHLNSMNSPQWRGAQTFYTRNHEDNEYLANRIQDEFKTNLNNTDREAKVSEPSLYLLKMSKIPSVLIEAGFLSNEEESTLLKNNKYQMKIANCIYQGIVNYYSSKK